MSEGLSAGGSLGADPLVRRWEAWRAESQGYILDSGSGNWTEWSAWPFIHSFNTHMHTITHIHKWLIYMPSPGCQVTGDKTMNKTDQIPVLTELTF